jgi:hypothetical protein
MTHSDSGSHMAAGARLQPASVAREGLRDAITLQQFLAINQNLSTIQDRLTATHNFIRAYQCFSIEIFALDRWRSCSTSPVSGRTRILLSDRSSQNRIAVSAMRDIPGRPRWTETLSA